jgi:DNA-binding GntR family transcriptional regulator
LEASAGDDAIDGEPRLLPVGAVFLKNLRDHVHDILRDAIVSGRLTEGEKLNERRLATQLGISTTPLKEALRVLEMEGLVRSEPRKGIYVTFGPAQAEEMTLARAALESMIARQAAKRVVPTQLARMRGFLSQMRAALAATDVPGLIKLNEKFHDVIHDASGCDYLRRLQNGQRMYDHAARLLVLADETERVRSVEEHAAIVEAIAAADPDLAERRMREHVIRAGERHLLIVFGQHTRN